MATVKVRSDGAPLPLGNGPRNGEPGPAVPAGQLQHVQAIGPISNDPGGSPRPGPDAQPLLPGLHAGYRTILMDPPWLEQGGPSRGAQRHYPIYSVADILRIVRESGRFLPHSDGCHLWCWATSNHLPDALWLLEQLGFRFVTTCCWLKAVAEQDQVEQLDDEQLAAALQIGLGQYLRHCHELLLLAVRGRLPVPPPAQRPPSVIIARRTQHSRKPEQQYALIEAVSPGPRLEMFARRLRADWDAWGNEL